MVKIIRKKPDVSVKKRILCKNCGVLLEYIPNDVKECNGTDYSGEPDGKRWIDCPGCGKEAIIDSW